MRAIFSKIINQITTGHSVVLCSIIAGSGSVPRGAGAKMAVFDDGNTIGTIGGGAVELNAIKLATDVHSTKVSKMHSYILSKNEISDIGMICGGNVTVFFQYIKSGDENAISLFRAAIDSIDGRKDSWLITKLEDSDAACEMGLFEKYNGLTGMELPLDMLFPLLCSKAVFHKPEEGTFKHMLYIEPLSRSGTVYIFGGGHVGLELMKRLSEIDFNVTVFDDRERLALEPLFSDKIRLMIGKYDSIDLPITESDYIVIMTPGHQADYEVLRFSLKTKARYIGCIGSKHKIVATRNRLIEDGFTQKDCNRIYSPIGLNIGAQTPAEIAISIAAQLISVRAGKDQNELRFI